jgi:hypothetical protein
MMVVGVKAHKQKELDKLMLEMAPIMSGHDKDGLGYMALTSKGMYGERWFNPAHAFQNRGECANIEEKIKETFEGDLEGSQGYVPFKQNNEAASEPKQAVIMHTRWATCEKSMRNVHPFYRDGVALIHNGVISNVRELTQITSTCDSEGILNSYVDNDVSNNPDNISKVGQFLRGSYTCGVLTRNADGVGVLDLFRSSPNLSACFIRELDALVFVTAEHMLITACRNLGWKHGAFMSLKDDKMVRINAATGGRISSHKFFSITGYGNSYAGSYDTGYRSGVSGGKFNQETHKWEYPTSTSHLPPPPPTTTDTIPQTAKKLVDTETDKLLQEQIEEARSNIIDIKNEREKKNLPVVPEKIKEAMILRNKGIATIGQVIGAKEVAKTGNS